MVTMLTFILSQDHITPFHTLGRFRLSFTMDSRDTFADGLTSSGDVTANWIVVDPISFFATNGTTISELSDHSLLASGANPTNDTYTVTAFTTATGITGFRLETLEDPSLPHDGPGRATENGNFCLTRFQVNAVPLPANGQDVALQQATATFSQSAFGNFSIAHTVGSNAPVSPGWSIYPNLVAQTAAFETVNDLGFNNGTRLTFTLSHNDPFPQNLGRFRLSVTTDARDTFADGLISGGDVTANWTVLDPISLSTAYGTILTELPDHSILASGVQPTNDTYTVTVFTAATGITGFRLEVFGRSLASI